MGLFIHLFVLHCKGIIHTIKLCTARTGFHCFLFGWWLVYVCVLSVFVFVVVFVFVFANKEILHWGSTRPRNTFFLCCGWHSSWPLARPAGSQLNSPAAVRRRHPRHQELSKGGFSPSICSWKSWKWLEPGCVLATWAEWEIWVLSVRLRGGRAAGMRRRRRGRRRTCPWWQPRDTLVTPFLIPESLSAILTHTHLPSLHPPSTSSPPPPPPSPPPHLSGEAQGSQDRPNQTAAAGSSAPRAGCIYLQLLFTSTRICIVAVTMCAKPVTNCLQLLSHHTLDLQCRQYLCTLDTVHASVQLLYMPCTSLYFDLYTITIKIMMLI